LCTLLLLGACTSRDDNGSLSNATDIDTGSTDASSSDSGSKDESSANKGDADSEVADVGTSESASTGGDSTDSASTNLTPSDSGTTDSSIVDTETTDPSLSVTTDNNSADSESTDIGTVDSGTTDSSSPNGELTDMGSTVAELQISCEVVSAQSLLNNGGFVRTVLPADLSAPGAQITVQRLQAGQFSAFDALSGAVDYVPGAGRLPSSVEYQISNAEGEVLASHEHRWVFDPVRVMPLGDSITSGVEYFDGTTDQPLLPERVGYRKFLYERLNDAGYAIDFVGQSGQNAGAAAGLADPHNNGYPGVDIAFINNKLLEVLGDDSADIILLHIGTNNTPQNAAAIDSLLITLDTWEAENHPVLALVATITPKRDAAGNTAVDVFNQDLRSRIAARVNDKLLLVEQNAALGLGDISDEQIGIHPNADGYRKMADVWFDALTEPESAALSKCTS